MDLEDFSHRRPHQCINAAAPAEHAPHRPEAFARCIVPSPDAFVEVLASLAAARAHAGSQQKLTNFTQEMAKGSQAELAWLKGLIFSAVLSIPYPQFVAEAKKKQPSGFTSIGSQPLQAVLDCIQAMGDGHYQKVLDFLDGVEKDRLPVIAMAVLRACRGQPLGFRSSSNSKQGSSSILKVELPAFIRLVTGFDKDIWCSAMPDGQQFAAGCKHDGFAAEGNTLFQHLIERVVAGSDGDRAWLRRFVWELALTHTGSLILQQAVAVCPWPDAKKVLLQSLSGNVWEACRSQHANFALQEYMRWLPADSWRHMVIQELKGHCEEAAKHDTGCRVLQRLIEHTNPTDAEPVLSEIINNRIVLRDLMLDKFGNYVVQHLLEHDVKGTQQQRVVDEMCRYDISRSAGGIHEIARHRVASHVVDQALTYCRPVCLAQLVEALLHDGEQLKILKEIQFGSFVFKHLVLVLENTFAKVRGKDANYKHTKCSGEWWYRSNLLLKALLKNHLSLPTLKLSSSAQSTLKYLCDANPGSPMSSSTSSFPCSQTSTESVHAATRAEKVTRPRRQRRGASQASQASEDWHASNKNVVRI